MVSVMTQEGGDGRLHGVPSLTDMTEFGPRTHVSMAFPGRGLEVGQEGGQKCPRCDSSHTKFCYYNNYSLSQPRYFCRSCKRYWTEGGTLRNVPVGGGCRKKQKKKKKNIDDNGPCINGSTFGIMPQSHSMVPFFPCAASELFPSCGPASFLGILNSGNVDHADETPFKCRLPPTARLTELPIMADLPTMFPNREVCNSVQDMIPDTEDEDYTLVGNSTKFFSSSFEWCRQQEVPLETTTTTTTTTNNNNNHNQVSLKRSMMLMMMEDGSMTDEELEKRVAPMPNEEIAMPEWQVPPISSSYEDFFEESW